MRDVRFRVLALLFAAAWLVLPGFGLIDLSVTWTPGWPVVLEAGWGLLFTVLVGGAFLAIVVVPRRAAPAVVQLLVVAAALAVSAAIALEGPAFALAAAVALEALIFLNVPERERIWPTPLVVWRPLALVAALGIIPWCVYARQMYASNRQDLADDITIGVDHYAVQGAAALSLAALVVLAALWPRGRRFIGVCVGVVGAYLGLVSFAWQGSPAAYSRAWSLLSIAWAAVVALLACLAPPASDRQRKSSPGTAPGM